MGSIRTLYALAVVFAHSWPYGMVSVGGKNAVQLFYIISGFLISYVLLESNSYGDLRSFYINRYLRLYPTYCFVAVITFIFYLTIKNPVFFGIYKTAPNLADALLIITNLTLFGQDLVMFSGVVHNEFAFVSDYNATDVVLYKGLLVPQAWSLGIELMFYLIAPFLLPRRKLIFLMLGIAFAIRAYLVLVGLHYKDPWTYRFFPAEISFFLLGALSHQLLLPLYKTYFKRRLNVLVICATCFLIFLSCAFPYIPVKSMYKSAVFFSVFIFFLPFAFIFQGKYRVDNWVGNLSYPIYIGHMLIFWIISYISEIYGYTNKVVISLSCVVISIVFAIFLNKYIGSPFERLRNNIRRRSERMSGIVSRRSVISGT